MAVPGQPVMEPETREQVLDLAAKGFAGTVFLTTDDVRSDYEELKARGVEFSEQPEERPYGIDAGLPRPVGQLVPAHPGEPAGVRLKRPPFPAARPSSVCCIPRSTASIS